MWNIAPERSDWGDERVNCDFIKGAMTHILAQRKPFSCLCCPFFPEINKAKMATQFSPALCIRCCQRQLILTLPSLLSLSLSVCSYIQRHHGGHRQPGGGSVQDQVHEDDHESGTKWVCVIELWRRAPAGMSGQPQSCASYIPWNCERFWKWPNKVIGGCAACSSIISMTPGAARGQEM